MTAKDYTAIVLEEVSRKFDIVHEGLQALDSKIERYRDENLAQHEDLKAATRFTTVDLRQRIDGLDQKIDAVEDRLMKRIDAIEVKLNAVAATPP